MKKIVFFGSPFFSAYLLQKLSQENFKILAVITQKAKPVGRKKKITPTSVKKTALNLKLPVFEFEAWDSSIKKVLKSADWAVVYSFGQIIPKEVLEWPRFGFLNLHPSLLPKYRGAAPVVYPLALGEKQTGMTIIKMDEKLDHGPILFQAKTEILKEESRDDLYLKLTEIGFEGLKKILIADPKKLILKPQNHKEATYTRTLSREDGYMKWKSILALSKGNSINQFELPRFLREYLKKYLSPEPQITLYNLYRALHPWPGLWSYVKVAGKEKRIKILEVDPQNKIKIVQLEGKKPVDFENFLKTAPVES